VTELLRQTETENEHSLHSHLTQAMHRPAENSAAMFCNVPSAKSGPISATTTKVGWDRPLCRRHGGLCG
jgi:hypothetical protein